MKVEIYPEVQNYVKVIVVIVCINNTRQKKEYFWKFSCH